MEEFTYQEKIAMMRILMDIIHADGIIDARETFFFNQLKDVFLLEESDHEAIKIKNSMLALVQIKKMDEEKKKKFSHLMAKMIVVDEDINVNEVAIYNIVSELCGFNTTFEESLEAREFANCSKS